MAKPICPTYHDSMVFFDEPIRIPADEVGSLAPESSDDDPHGWQLLLSRTDNPGEGKLSLYAAWVCGGCVAGPCGSISVSVPPRMSAFTAGGAAAARSMAEMLLRDLLARLRAAPSHPRCSEVRTVQEVMGS